MDTEFGGVYLLQLGTNLPKTASDLRRTRVAEPFDQVVDRLAAGDRQLNLRLARLTD
jgi:hypothetical protein